MEKIEELMIYSLWLPNDKIDYDEIDNFIKWAEICDSCIWVRLNKNIEDYFEKSILDFCICSDWNFSFDGKSGHTEIGELEKKYSSISLKIPSKRRSRGIITVFVFFNIEIIIHTFHSF